MSEPILVSPPPEHEKELRQLYRERNAQIFKTPATQSKFDLNSRTGLIVVILLLGLVVSLLTSFATSAYLQPMLAPQVVERPIRVLATTSEVNNELTNRLAGSAVAVFAARSQPKGSAVSEAYLASEALGQALVLSSDGWLVTTPAVVGDTKKTYMVATAENRLLPVELAVTDPAIPLVYLKVTASNLTATSFAEFANLEIGQSVVAVSLSTQSSSPSVYLRHLSSLQAPVVTQRTDLTMSSETISDRYLLDRALPAGNLGAPIANARGEVVGLAALIGGEIRAVVPLDNLSVMINSLFSSRQVRRPMLGLSYTQANWLRSFLPSTVAMPEGAVVTPAGKRPAVVAKSAAALAGVKEGDRIIYLAGERLGSRSLSAMLQQYSPGSKIELTIERQTKELKLMVTLGEIVASAVVEPVVKKDQAEVKK
jgi:S1-C subfamily serine protease